MKRILLLLLPCLFWASAADLGPFQAELKALLPSNPKAGVAIGHFTADSETIIFVGNPAFDRETLFEYGSITKVFTSVVLAELAQEGVVDLEQSVNRFLPEDVRDEKWRDVTLFDLATHSAGLPIVPDNSYIHTLLNPHDPTPVLMTRFFIRPSSWCGSSRSASTTIPISASGCSESLWHGLATRPTKLWSKRAFFNL